jgi:desulfoferrodoxin (superoxide reductase-like protein)
MEAALWDGVTWKQRSKKRAQEISLSRPAPHFWLSADSGRHLSRVRSEADGHRSIQVKVDVYGHPIPGEHVAWIDTLDSTPKVAAADENRTQTQSRESEAGFSEEAQNTEAEAVFGCPPGIRTPIC